jgi:hypothetical protein
MFRSPLTQKNKMIVEQAVTNDVLDMGLLQQTAEPARQILDVETIDEAFLKPVHRGMILVEEKPDALLVEEKPDALLDAVRRYQPSSATKWIGRDER